MKLARSLHRSTSEIRSETVPMDAETISSQPATDPPATPAANAVASTTRDSPSDPNDPNPASPANTANPANATASDTTSTASTRTDASAEPAATVRSGLRQVTESRAATAVLSRLRRLGRNSRWMSLRRVPLLLAIVTALLSAPIVWWLAQRWAEAEAAKQWSYVVRDAIEKNGRAVATLAGGPKVDDGSSWIVYPSEKRYDALGETDIEPPLFRLAEAAKDSPQEAWFSQGDRPFYSYTRPIDGKAFAVSVTDTNYYDEQTKEQHSSIIRGAFVVWLLTAGLAGAVAHLLTRPARRTLTERADFLADAAHEMRTPLSVIQASAGHALSRPRPPEDYIQSLAEIRTAAERAGAGVTELLDLARFDAGQAVPRLAPLRLDLLAEELAVSTRVDGCDVTTEVGPSVLVEADMALLRQAIDNIVRNAAARSTLVVLRCSIEGRDGVVRVVDNGPGFAPEQLPYVFERYRRGDGRGSLGLGLPIAASIVAAHGGRIDIESPAPSPAAPGSPGAEVTIRLPRSKSR